jgi:hypothetical protein
VIVLLSPMDPSSATPIDFYTHARKNNIDGGRPINNEFHLFFVVVLFSIICPNDELFRFIVPVNTMCLVIASKYKDIIPLSYSSSSFFVYKSLVKIN